MKRFFRLLLMLFTYPSRVAEAVNTAKTPEEFDHVLENG